MPQFELSNFASQIFWLALSFTVLYLVMARSTLPNIREILQERRERVAADIEKAEAIKKKAEEAKTDYTSALSNARVQAKQIVTEADEEIKKEIELRGAKLDETLNRQIKEAELLVAKSREEAVEKLTPVSVEVAQVIVEKLVGKKVELSRVQAVVDKLVKDKNSVFQSQGGMLQSVRKAS